MTRHNYLLKKKKITVYLQKKKSKLLDLDLENIFQIHEVPKLDKWLLELLDFESPGTGLYTLALFYVF